MELEGVIVHIKDTNQITDTFKKREFVVATEGKYSQEIVIECVQEQVSLLDTFKVNHKVKVSINLRGSKSTKGAEPRWFNSLQAWRIDLIGEVEGSKESDLVPSPQIEGDDEEDDLPF